MGTNYYAMSNVCECCGHPEEEKHIGKSSAGWCFSLHVYPEDGINDLDDWVSYLGDKQIRNEYGENILLSVLLAIIKDRSWKRTRAIPHGYSSYEDFYKINFAIEGPNGLVRHKMGQGCIGHGEGTWDLITGEFS